MKRWLCFLLMGMISLPVFSTERKKVGLVLGGGGAKGMAHIGALKVIEEAGIPIDYIAGTSMGAIVGGLYAIGYSAAEIDSMVHEQNWALLLSDRVERSSQSFPEKENSERYIISVPFGKERKDRSMGGVVRGQNLQNLFSNLTIGYHDSVDFNSFHIPYACVAVEILSGKEKVFREGSLPVAMRASMAIPAFFTPVRQDSMVFVDGGLFNNYPADVALDMGADILLGIDLGSSDLKSLDQIITTSDVLGQIVGVLGYDKYAQNKDTTELLIRPDLHPYNSASFAQAAIDTLIMRGEQAARLQWNELIAFKEKIGIIEEAGQTAHPVLEKEGFYVRSISFEGIDSRDEKWLKQISGLKENNYVSLKKLEEAMSIIVGTNAYSSASYKLTGEQQQDLVLMVEEKPISSISLGVRFDSEETVAVLLNGTLSYRTKGRSRLAFTGRVGKRSYGRFDYSVGPNLLRNFGLSYMFTHNDLNIYNHGDKTLNTTYWNHMAELAYSDMNWLSFKLKVGARYDYYNYNDFLYREEDHIYDVKSEHFFNYFIEAYYDNMDRNYFPRRGVSFRTNYTVYTNNFITRKGKTPFSALGMDFQSVVPLTSHLSLLPSVSGRVLIGRNVAYPYLNAIGGEIPGKYLSQQLPFAGINHVELLENSVVIARMHLRQRIASRHYLSLIGNYGVHEDDFFSLFDDGRHMWGGSLGYAYSGVTGPLSANIGVSNRSNKPLLFLNLGYYF